MNKEEFEMYCRDHNWKIEIKDGFIIVSKGDMMFKDICEIGIPLRDLVHKMKEAEFGSDSVQGMFLFTSDDPLA